MKRIALPVLGAVICLQILSGCKETGQSSNVRVAGKSADKNATIAAKTAQKESAIKEEELSLDQLKAYGDYVEFMLKNIRGQQADTFGMDAFIKSHRWITLSLYGKNPDATVLASSRTDGKVGYTSFQTAKAVYFDTTTFSEAEDVLKAKMILRQIVTGLRLQTKGVVNSLETSAEDNAQQSQLDEARDVLDQANKASVESQLSEMPSDSGIVGSSEAQNNGEVSTDISKDNSIQTKARLDATDVEGINAVTEYLMARGSSAKIDEVKAYLLKYKIIR